LEAFYRILVKIRDQIAKDADSLSPGIASSLSGGSIRWFKQYVERLPVPEITKNNANLVKQIEENVDKILELKKKGDEAKAKKISDRVDELVYELYGLTEDEIQLIEAGEMQIE